VEAAMIVTTMNDVPGRRIVKVLGLARGVTVRLRNIVGTLGGALHSLVGGNITAFTNLAERSRQEACNILVAHAEAMGADAVVAMRYDANEIASGITEVLAYGTAVTLAEA
jgi:uncharacterized protein YbjQ (UPF0145 family)